MRRGVLLALIIVVSVLAAPKAYVLNGHPWATTSVTYVVNVTNKFGITQDALLAAVANGANAWGQAGANIHFTFGGTSSCAAMTQNGQNCVFFRDDTNGGYIAETYWWYDGSDHMVDADVVFHEGLVAMFASTGCVNGIYIDETAMHELGHALGLAHSADGSAIMASSVGYCDPRRSLETDDINGVLALYPLGPIPPSPSPSPTPIPTPSPTPTPTPTPTPGPVGPLLSLRAYRVKGFQTVDLSWRGLTSTQVDLYRNGVVLRTMPNDGAETDALNRKGGGSYLYRVCESSTTTCTNPAQATF